MILEIGIDGPYAGHVWVTPEAVRWTTQGMHGILHAD